MTLYEKIKTMTVEEMAKYFDSQIGCMFCVYFSGEDTCLCAGCTEGIIEYLNQEVKP